MSTKSQHLEDLARTLVGDGQEPNIFFVNQDGVIKALLLDEGKESLDQAIALAGQYSGSVVVEDRRVGVIWENELSERRQMAEEE